MNTQIKNDTLRLSAQQALRAMEQGHYQTRSGSKVSIREELATACDGTTLYLPDAFTSLWERLSPETETPRTPTAITVENASTLSVAARLRQHFERVALLNFASARNPGGGFLSGARAQEESLARSSGLYATLKTQPEFYAYHRQVRSVLYSDRVIFSPDVPVFTDDAHEPLDTPWTVSMLTCAAVNTGALERNEPQKLQFVRSVMEQRARMVLAVAATQNIEALVLGAWGCGVFQCDPELIAGCFAEALESAPLKGRFRHVAFAILSPKRSDDPNLGAFQRRFGDG